jgi:ABC-type multidrug transport system ATPase subunit
MELWKFIDELVREGTTLLLTTQYLEEADRLADRIAVIERGRMIASGTPTELKERVAGDVLEVRCARFGDLDRLVGLLTGIGSGPPVADAHGQRVTVPTRDRVATLLAAARRIDEAGLEVDDITLRRPSLDDVFLTLTSTRAPDAPAMRQESRTNHTTKEMAA